MYVCVFACNLDSEWNSISFQSFSVISALSTTVIRYFTYNLDISYCGKITCKTVKLNPFAVS